MNRMLQQQTCRNDKELVCRWTKTCLNQRKRWSNYCRNPEANTDKTPRMVTDKVATGGTKRYAIRGFQKKDMLPHAFSCPNSKI